MKVTVSFTSLTPSEATALIELAKEGLSQSAEVQPEAALEGKKKKKGKKKKPVEVEELEDDDEADDEEELEDDDEADDDDESDAPTQDEVMNAFKTFVRGHKDKKKGRLAAKKILKKLKVASVNELIPKQYQQALDMFDA